MKNQTTRRAFLAAGAASAVGMAFSGSSASAKESAEEKKEFGGVVSVLVTPYRDDRTIDTEAMTRLCGRFSEVGVDGVFIAGSTGDMALLSIEERTALIASGRKGLGAKTNIFGGATDYSIPRMIDNTKRFADAGADVAVIMAPIMFFTYSQAELTAYFREIADRSALPILIYHHTRVSTPVEVETVRAVMDHPNIIGMKETGANFERSTAILEAVRNASFLFMQGNEPYAAESYRAGCHGALSALAGVWPELYLAIDRSYRKKEEAAFQKATDNLAAMCEVFRIMPTAESFSYFGWTMKRMLQYRGWLENLTSRMPGFIAKEEWNQTLTAFLKERDFPTA